MATPKVVSDPVYGIIDIRPVLSMVETKEFQTLGDKRQLGMTHLVFPSATHTRKAHSLGAYHATRELADRWVKQRSITKREADALAGYALYHDIGHPPLSHVTEPLCAMPRGAKRGMSMNTAQSLAVIRTHRKAIVACGIDFKLLEALAAHEHPLHAAVSDKNIGMEKLDYLERDGMVTILGKPVGISYLREHIYFTDKRLAIDEKAIDSAIEAQNFYIKMYKNVYLRKTSAIAQRMVQKMVHHLIDARELSRRELPSLTDSELMGMMRLSRDRTVRQLYDLLARRDLFREAVVIRPKRFADAEEHGSKGVAIFGVDAAAMRRLIEAPSYTITNQRGLAALEATIERIAGLDRGTVLVTPVFNPNRFFNAEDILIFRGKGKKPGSLKERFPAHFKNIEEVAQNYLAFRVCTTDEHRKKLASPATARKIFGLLAEI